FRTGCQASSVQHAKGAVSGVTLNDGTMIAASHVIIAAPPAVAHKLVPGADTTALRLWKEQAIEVTAACLDVALRKLPMPKQQFVYGIDRPIFLTNQSRAAKLSDDGAQVVCLIKYQGTESDPEKDRRDLEQTLDLV